VQCHAARFFATSCLILHATAFLATPCLVLGTLLHVLKMIAIESQKLISNTSDVVDTKVITTGETNTPSLLDKFFPSINDFFAGDLLACNLLRAQPATLKHILHELIDLDDPPFRAQLVALQCTLHKLVDQDKLDIGNDEVCKLGIRHMAPYLSIAMHYKFHIGSTMPCPRLAMRYALCIMPTMLCLTAVMRSLLANH